MEISDKTLFELDNELLLTMFDISCCLDTLSRYLKALTWTSKLPVMSMAYKDLNDIYKRLDEAHNNLQSARDSIDDIQMS